MDAPVHGVEGSLTAPRTSSQGAHNAVWVHSSSGGGKVERIQSLEHAKLEHIQLVRRDKRDLIKKKNRLTVIKEVDEEEPLDSTDVQNPRDLDSALELGPRAGNLTLELGLRAGDLARNDMDDKNMDTISVVADIGEETL